MVIDVRADYAKVVFDVFLDQVADVTVRPHPLLVYGSAECLVQLGREVNLQPPPRIAGTDPPKDGVHPVQVNFAVVPHKRDPLVLEEP